MMRARMAGATIAAAAAILTVAGPASGGTTHTYPVTLTIEVDRAAHRISGTVASDAPAQFCEESTVRIREVMPGRDKVVAFLTPSDLSVWGMRSWKSLRGARVYAEVSTYTLPSRPVVCLGARSRTVTAP